MKFWLTLAAVLSLVASAVAGVSWIRHLQREAAKVPELEQARDKARRELHDYRIQTVAEVTRVNGIAAQYAAEVQRLRAAPGAVHIRVCQPPPGTGPATLNPAPGAGATPAAASGGSLSGPPEMPAARDIGPDLELSARLADELSAQVRGWLMWADSLPKQCLIAP